MRLIRVIKATSISYRLVCYFILGIFLLEIILLHGIIIYSYFKLKNYFLPLYDPDQRTLIEQLSASKFSRELMFSAKYGGLSSLLQNTLERIYIVNHGSLQNDSISSLRFDVSHSGEFLYIYRRILSRKSFPFSKLVIDVGANDGFLSSNSFNFIQHGWNGILVDPLKEQLHLAKYHLSRYNNQYNENLQYVQYVEAVLGDRDGAVKLVVGSDLAEMESHIINEQDYDGRSKRVRMVQGISVETFVEKYQVPKHFGVLSVDAEGSSNTILQEFIRLGYRPAYIIYEGLHVREESVYETTEKLSEAGYKYLTQRGWNHIYELKHEH